MKLNGAAEKAAPLRVLVSQQLLRGLYRRIYRQRCEHFFEHEMPDLSSLCDALGLIEAPYYSVVSTVNRVRIIFYQHLGLLVRVFEATKKDLRFVTI